MLVLLLLALLSGVQPASCARKAYSALYERVDQATLICIGSVQDLVEVAAPPGEWRNSQGAQRLSFARVAVERVLKGPADTGVIHHEAWGTWPCDTTRAQLGERALLLLSHNTQLARAPDSFRDEVMLALGADEVLRNVGSGDGILRIREEQGAVLVSSAGMPNSLRANRYDAKLADVLHYVEQLVRFSPERVTVRAARGWSMPSSRPSSTFDLRILDDGSCRFATSLRSSEEVRTFQLEAREWDLLRSALELPGMRGDQIVGDPKVWKTRQLVMRLSAGTLTFVESREWNPQALSDAERPLFRHAMRSWAAILGAFDCPEDAGERERDGPWIEDR